MRYIGQFIGYESAKAWVNWTLASWWGAAALISYLTHGHSFVVVFCAIAMGVRVGMNVQKAWKEN